jgi:SAM-dependent methyltransferase
VVDSRHRRGRLALLAYPAGGWRRRTLPYSAQGRHAGWWAADFPRRLRFALDRFQLDKKRVLDLGCGPGTYLAHFGKGSVGLDISPERARAKGLDARFWDFTKGIPSDLREFDSVWCSNLLEHVLAPHAFLIELRHTLRSDGLLLVVIPQTSRVALGPWKGSLAKDHVNFFTPLTLKLTVERAGYDIEWLGAPSVPDRFPGFLRRLRLGPSVLVAARPIPDFQYPEKAHKRLVEGRIEYSPDFGEAAKN